jgi:hypothetical protein
MLDPLTAAELSLGEIAALVNELLVTHGEGPRGPTDAEIDVGARQGWDPNSRQPCLVVHISVRVLYLPIRATGWWPFRRCQS